MKIIFIGGVKFSQELFQHIILKKWKISALFTYDDSKKKIYSDFATFDNIKNNDDIIHVKTNNINDKENIELIKKISPDLILVMGWSQILKSEILNIPKLGIIGSHPTELPKYRGRAPISWSILKELKKSALTFFWMDDGIDNGDILDQQFFKISINDDASSIYEKIILLGQKMLDDNLLLIKSGKIKRTKQDSNKFIEYWNKRTPEDGRINWNDNGISIYNLIRASTKPYPGAFTVYKNKKFIFWKAKLLKNMSHSPGKILDVSKNSFKVGTSDGVILIKKFSYNGKSNIDLRELFPNNYSDLILGN
jgi:methionyl-tRNA formyltransferase